MAWWREVITLKVESIKIKSCGARIYHETSLAKYRNMTPCLLWPNQDILVISLATSQSPNDDKNKKTYCYAPVANINVLIDKQNIYQEAQYT